METVDIDLLHEEYRKQYKFFMKMDKWLVALIVLGMVLNIIAGSMADATWAVFVQAFFFGVNGCNLVFTIKRMEKNYNEARREEFLYNDVKYHESIIRMIDNQEKPEI